jgi:hypothetical protein
VVVHEECFSGGNVQREAHSKDPRIGFADAELAGRENHVEWFESTE